MISQQNNKLACTIHMLLDAVLVWSDKSLYHFKMLHIITQGIIDD